MGNIIRSLFSGIGNAISSLFEAPFNFLSGKACSSVCGSTWDLICYFENFCIGNLLKMAAILALIYIALLFFYLLYNMGITGCIGRSMCKMCWACFESCYSWSEYGFTLVWYKLKTIRHNRRLREEYIEDEEYDSSSTLDGRSSSYLEVPRVIEVDRSRWMSQRSREHRRLHLHQSLRPRSNHRIKVGVNRHSIYVNERRNASKHHARHVSTVRNVKVTRTSKIVQKAHVGGVRRRKW